jgi:hypothetical protein
MTPSPLGETLRRARLTKGVTFEDAERITRIPRKYLEALELENFGILPAPVYARGFLRSYASYLGLDAGALLPFFPVGHVEEPRLEPLPEVRETPVRQWNASGLIAMGVVGALILLVIGLYTIGREESNAAFLGEVFDPAAQQQTLPQGGAPVAGDSEGPALALPDLVGQSMNQAIAYIDETGATYIVVSVPQGDTPSGTVVDQSPPAGTEVGPGNLVTITVAE